jgi:hypothetical protein
MHHKIRRKHSSGHSLHIIQGVADHPQPDARGSRLGVGGVPVGGLGKSRGLGFRACRGSGGLGFRACSGVGGKAVCSFTRLLGPSI